MAVKLKRSNLQEDKYVYTSKRDKGDGKYIGPLDRAKIDKDEGYEVLEFIENLMNAHRKDKLSDVHAVENALHAPELNTLVSRSDLNTAAKAALRW